MGDEVANDSITIERGLWGFLCGRRWGPGKVPSLDMSPDGRPWTYHHTSPMVPRADMARVCDGARQQPSGDAWAVAVQASLPALGAWLVGRFPREREALWVEARGLGL